MKSGDRVSITSGPWAGETGIIEKVCAGGRLKVRINDKLAAVKAQHVEAQSHDFDGGFGIGGLGRHKEPPFAPTAKQMRRMEKLEAKATRCRKCGQSDVFDGAMFTTGGGNVCDDCFG